MCRSEDFRSLCGHAKQLGNKESLTKCITFDHPSDSALPDHIHRFDALQCPPRTLKRAVPFGEPDAFLHSPVILLHYII